MVMALSDLGFADLAVECVSPGQGRSPASGPSQMGGCGKVIGRFKRFSGDLRLELVPDACQGDLVALQAALADNPANVTRYRMEWQGMKLRVQRRDTPNGPVWILRRIASVLLLLDQLGIPSPIVQKLRRPELRGGLLLFAGGPGAGKSTAACAVIVDRLETIGGFTWTAENPVEYDLQGPHGAGQCYQEEINEDLEIQRVLMDTLRSSADTFFIGEIREETSARAACLAAASGMLVLSTLHADSAQQALLKIGMLAGMDGLSQSLRGIITMRMDRELSAANGPQRVLKVQPFFVEDESLRQKIAKGDMAAINMDLETQRNRFLMGAR